MSMPNISWEERYDKFLSFGSWLNAFFYGVPATALLTAFWIFSIPESLWTPALLIYGIAALAHMLNYGGMATNIQIKIAADFIAEALQESKGR